MKSPVQNFGAKKASTKNASYIARITFIEKLEDMCYVYPFMHLRRSVALQLHGVWAS